MHVDDARGDAHLNRVVVDVQEREARVAVETHGGLPDLDFGARALLGPQLVAGGQRAIDDGARPFFLAGGLQRHFALQQAETGRAIRRVRIGRRVLLPRASPNTRQRKIAASAGSALNDTLFMFGFMYGVMIVLAIPGKFRSRSVSKR